MPNRILRDWTNSEKIDTLTAQEEVFFTRLIMKVDDFGRYYAKENLLKAALYPNKLDQIREADIARWSAACAKAGLIVLYEVGQKRYLQITDFGQRLRQKVEKYPPPPDDGQLTVNCQHEEKGREVETEVETKGKGKPPAPALKFIYDLSYFKNLGHDWQLSDTLKGALNKYLLYRANNFEPITAYETVESIIRQFGIRAKTDEEAVLMVDHTIIKNAKNIIFELPRAGNAFRQETSKTYKNL